MGMVTSGGCLEGKGPGVRGSESTPWGSPLSVGVVSEGLSDECQGTCKKWLRRCPETHPEASLWAQIALSHLGQLGALDKQDGRYLEPSAQAPPQPGRRCWVLPFSRLWASWPIPATRTEPSEADAESGAAVCRSQLPVAAGGNRYIARRSVRQLLNTVITEN